MTEDEGGSTISTEVKDKDGPSQLNTISMTGSVKCKLSFRKTQCDSVEFLWRHILSFGGSRQFKSGIDLKGLRVTSYEGGG